MIPAIILPLAFFARIPETPLDKAIALVKVNKSAAALPLLEEIAQKQPANHDVLPWLALSYLSTDRIAEGRTALDTAIKVKLPCKTLVAVIESYSRYYQQQNDFTEADHLLSSIINLCPETTIDLQRNNLYIAWSDDDFANGRIPDAITHLELVSGNFGDNNLKEQISHKLADYYRQLAAKAETTEGNDRKAIALLKKSLTISDEPASRMALANIYWRTNDCPNAIEQFLGVAQSDPNNLEARHHLIDLYLKTGNIKAAQIALSELADKERCVENYQLLSALHLKLNNYAGAVRALEEALSLNPKDTWLLNRLREALIDWSTVLLRQGKQEEFLSVKGRAERLAEILRTLDKASEAEAAKNGEGFPLKPGAAPFSLYASRIWLSKGSYTPEGEIRVKNISAAAVTDISLSIVFYDNTKKKKTGTITVSAASASHPITPGQIRSIYFSSPNIVRTDSQLCVIIFWKDRLLTQLPVVKER